MRLDTHPVGLHDTHPVFIDETRLRKGSSETPPTMRSNRLGEVGTFVHDQRQTGNKSHSYFLPYCLLGPGLGPDRKLTRDFIMVITPVRVEE